MVSVKKLESTNRVRFTVAEIRNVIVRTINRDPSKRYENGDQRYR